MKRALFIFPLLLLASCGRELGISDEQQDTGEPFRMIVQASRESESSSRGEEPCIRVLRAKATERDGALSITGAQYEFRRGQIRYRGMSAGSYSGGGAFRIIDVNPESVYQVKSELTGNLDEPRGEVVYTAENSDGDEACRVTFRVRFRFGTRHPL